MVQSGGVHGAGALHVLQGSAVSAFPRPARLSQQWQRVRRQYAGSIAAHSRLDVDFQRRGTPAQLRAHATVAVDDVQLLPVLSHVPFSTANRTLRTVFRVPTAADLIVLGSPGALLPADSPFCYFKNF